MNKRYLLKILFENKHKFIKAGYDIYEVEDLEGFIEDIISNVLEKEFDITIDYKKLFNKNDKKKEQDYEM